MNRVSTIASRLKEYRDIHEFTLADMEQKIGIPAQTLNRYELGQRAPKIDVAVQIAERLGINPLWLQGYDVLEDEENPTPVSEGGPSDEAMKVARAYDQADPKDQRTVRVILDIEDEYSIGLVARGGKTVTPTRTARKSVIDQLTRESEAEADKENERL